MYDFCNFLPILSHSTVNAVPQLKCLKSWSIEQPNQLRTVIGILFLNSSSSIVLIQNHFLVGNLKSVCGFEFCVDGSEKIQFWVQSIIEEDGQSDFTRDLKKICKRFGLRYSHRACLILFINCHFFFFTPWTVLLCLLCLSLLLLMEVNSEN